MCDSGDQPGRRGAGAAAGGSAHRPRAGHGPRAGSVVLRRARVLVFLPQPVGFVHRRPQRLGRRSSPSRVTAIVVGELAARAERRQLEAAAGTARDRAALRAARRGVRTRQRSRSGAAERTAEGGAARRADPQPPHAADRDQGVGHGAASAPATPTRRPAGLSSDSRRELLHVIDEESDRLNRFIEALSARRSAGSDRREQRALRAVELRSCRRCRGARGDRVRAGIRCSGARRTAARPLAVDRGGGGGGDLHPAGQRQQVCAAGRHERSASGRRTRRRMAMPGCRSTDQGPGIPAGSARAMCSRSSSRIPGRESFDPRRPGVGLGLPIARRLSKSQAGRIWIETAAGSGTSGVHCPDPAVSRAASRTTCSMPKRQSASCVGDGHDQRMDKLARARRRR